MTISHSSMVLLDRVICGVQVSKRGRKIRLCPYCEVRGGFYQLRRLQEDLLEISVTCAIRPEFVRINGIENCSTMTRFIDKKWFLEVMVRFKNGEHLTKKGVLAILQSRPYPKNSKLRISTEEIIQLLMEN